MAEDLILLLGFVCRDMILIIVGIVVGIIVLCIILSWILLPLTIESKLTAINETQEEILDELVRIREACENQNKDN